MTNVLKALLGTVAHIPVFPGPADSLDPSNTGGGFTLTNSNLTATAPAATGALSRSVSSYSTGKYHFEVTITFSGTPSIAFGVCSAGANLNVSPGLTGGDSIGAYDNNSVHGNNSGLGSWAASIISGDVVAVEVDVGAGLIWFKDVTQGGDWNDSGTADPATGAGGYSLSSGSVGTPTFACVGAYSGGGGGSATINFGATSFALAPSSGFSAWD